MRIPFVGPTYQSRSVNIDASRSVNFYPEMNPADSKSVIALVGTPGTVLFVSLPSSPIRCLHVFDAFMYVVAGNSLYSVDIYGNVSGLLGTLITNTNTGRVTMEDNGTGGQLMIVDGANGYIYNAATGNFLLLALPQFAVPGAATGTFINQETVTQASTGATAQVIGVTVPAAGPMMISGYSLGADASHTWTGTVSGATFVPTAAPLLAVNGFPANGAGTVTNIDGYFVIGQEGTLYAYASNLYDGTTWDPLAMSPIAGAPDLIQTVINIHQQLWIVKQHTSEVWYDAGTPTTQGFPFSRISGAVIDYGTPAPASVARGDNSFFFLAMQRGSSGVGEFVGVVEVSGYTPQIITPPAVTYQMNQYAVTNYDTYAQSDAFAYCYSAEGHTFYVITFPTGNATWVYDASTQMWHERSTWVSDPYVIGRHIGNCSTSFFGRHFIGDWQSGNIYEMRSDTYQDNGNPLVSMRTAQHLFDKQDLDHIFIRRLILDMETGVGNALEANPQVGLAWSDDGGHTWSNQYTAPMGATGQYRARVIWRRLGHSRDRIFQVTISDPVKRILIGAYGE